MRQMNEARGLREWKMGRELLSYKKPRRPDSKQEIITSLNIIFIDVRLTIVQTDCQSHYFLRLPVLIQFNSIQFNSIQFDLLI